MLYVLGSKGRRTLRPAVRFPRHTSKWIISELRHPPAMLGIILNSGLRSANDRGQTEHLARSIEADGLQVFVAVNPTFFAVDADFYPDVVGYSQPDSVFPFFPRH